MIERLAASGALRIEYFTEPGVLDNEPRERLLPTLRGLVQALDVSALFALHAHASAPGNAELIERAILEVAVEAEVNLPAWSESRSFWASDIAVLHLALKDRGGDGAFNRDALPNLAKEYADNTHFEEGFGSLLIYSFFSSLALHLLPSATVSILSPANSHHNEELLRFQSAIERAAQVAAILLKSEGRLDYEFIFEQTKHVPLFPRRDFESMERYKRVKRALHEIAIRLQIFCMAQGVTGLISPLSITRAKECKHFSVGRLMADAADVHIRLLQPELLGNLVASELSNVQAANQEIGETIEALLELAQLSLIQRSRDDVRKICQKIWALVLGYGKHKDLAILDLLQAIEYMAFVDKGFATEKLLSISGVIEKVTTFTDGDETNSVHRYVADALREANPFFLAKKYRYHLERGDWSEAQDTIRGALETINPESPFTAALARTGLLENEMPKSWRATGDGQAAHRVYQASLDFLGIDVTIEKPERNTSHESKQFDANFKQYPPSDFSKLLAAMREAGHFYERDGLRSWYQYWSEAGHGNLVNSLDKYLHQDNDYDAEVRYILDQLFDSTLSLFGRERAFRIAVLAQVENGGWSSWPMTESHDASRARLKKVAEIYPERALEFLTESCTRPDKMFREIGEPSYTIPGVLLIYFLVHAKQVDLAKSYLVSMVASLMDETNMFSLPRPEWSLSQQLSDAELPLQLLICRLKSGVATTRLWAMQELVGLLVSDDTRSLVEAELVAHIKLIRLDTELVEVLGLLCVARMEGFEFSSAFHIADAGSIVAEELCGMLGLGYTRRRILAAPQRFVAPRDFFKVDGLPEMLSRDLERLQKSIQFPVISQACFEATRLADILYYTGSVEFFFRGGREKMHGALLSNAMQIARSAYLRALSVACEVGMLPVEQSLDGSRAAMPFSPLFVGMRSTEPEFWRLLCRSLRDATTNVPLTLSEMLGKVGDTEQTVGALNAPVYISENEFWELEIVLCAYQAPMEFFEVISELPSDDGFSEFLVSELLSDKTIYQCKGHSKKTGEQRARRIAAPFLVVPHAYLHLEVFQRGVYLPTTPDAEEEFYVAPDAHGISVYSSQLLVGDFSYWNTEWSPAYPSSKGPGCATLLLLQRDALRSLLGSGEELIYRCTIARHRRDHSYDEFEVDAPEELVLSFK